MSDVVYTVAVQIGTQGGLTGPLDVATGKAGALDSAFSKIGGSIETMGGKLAGFLDSAVAKVEGIAVGIAKWGAAGAIGLATYGVGKLNNELEQTNLSLAAIFNAQGFASNFNDALTLASEQLGKMKRDVRSLPGDLGQLSDIMKTIATPAAMGGASPDAIRELAGRSMLVGKILGVQQEVVAREMAGLLTGRAGSHNILGTRLGLVGGAAEQFNKSTAGERLADIQKRFQAFAPAADAFSKSMVANWTTLVDNIKYTLLAPGTAPLFEHVKATIIQINDYFEKHRAQIENIVDKVGNRLAAGWDYIVSRAEKLLPIVEKIGDRVMKMTSRDWSSMFGKAAAIGVGAKLAPTAIEAGSSLAGKAVSALGGGGADALAGVAESLTTLANPAILGPLAAGLAFLGETFMAVVGAVHAVTDETSMFHKRALALWVDIQASAGDTFSKLADAFDKTWPLWDAAGTFLLDVLASLARGFDRAANAADRIMSTRFMKWLVEQIGGMAGGESPGGPGAPRPVADVVSGASKVEIVRDNSRRGKMPLGAGGGGGGTTIHQVVIQVSSNQDPSMIARVLEARLGQLARHPRSSRFVTNWSAGKV